MAIDFNTLQTNLTTWVEMLLGVDYRGNAIPCEWGRQSQKIIIGPMVLAYAGPITPLGHDFPQYTYDSQTDQQIETMYGIRRFPLRLSFRSDEQGLLGSSARQYAEEFRLLVQSTSSIAYLTANCIGFVSMGELVETDYEWSGRMMSQVDATVFLSMQLDSTNPMYSGDYINTVNLTEENYIITEEGHFIISEAGAFVTNEGHSFSVSGT